MSNLTPGAARPRSRGIDAVPRRSNNRAMSTRHAFTSGINNSSIGRQSAPAFQRDSTSFGSLDGEPGDPWRHRRRRAPGTRTLLVAALVTLSLGVAVMVQLVLLLQGR